MGRGKDKVVSVDTMGYGRKQRKYRRIPQHLPVQLRFASGEGISRVGPAVKGVISDIGAAGIHVLLGTPYYAGTRFIVTCQLDGKTVNFTATVRHVRWYSGTPEMAYGHGMQITAVEEATLLEIVQYIERHSGHQYVAPIKRAA